MLPNSALFCLVFVSSTLTQAYTPKQQNHAVIERRARTVTVTEYEVETETVTETTTETKTVTLSATCNSLSSRNTPASSSATTSGFSSRTTPAMLSATTTYSTSTRPATSSLATTTSTDVSFNGKCYAISGVGSYAVKKSYDFTSGQMPSELTISNYDVADQQAGDPWNHGFRPSNVMMKNGLLNLVVPGRQNPGKDSNSAIYGAEIVTTESKILYGSIRTKAIFDDTPGTCQGIFSYHDDTAEIDIEYMGNSSSLANPSPAMPPVFWYTNQPGGLSNNQKTGLAPNDVTSKVHEYRIDWTKDWTKFYIDGVSQNITLTDNVPKVGSYWVWNNWSNGNAYWSTGPPVNDNVFKIQSITMYYNVENGASC